MAEVVVTVVMERVVVAVGVKLCQIVQKFISFALKRDIGARIAQKHKNIIARKRSSRLKL